MYIAEWQCKAIPIVMAVFPVVREMEKAVFGQNSFYYHKGQFQTYGILRPKAIPDQDVLGEEELAVAGEEGMLFAEEAEALAEAGWEDGLGMDLRHTMIIDK